MYEEFEEDIFENEAEQLLDDDEVSAAEEGFMKGYDEDGY